MITQLCPLILGPRKRDMEVTEGLSQDQRHLWEKPCLDLRYLSPSSGICSVRLYSHSPTAGQGWPALTRQTLTSAQHTLWVGTPGTSNSRPFLPCSPPSLCQCTQPEPSPWPPWTAPCPQSRPSRTQALPTLATCHLHLMSSQAYMSKQQLQEAPPERPCLPSQHKPQLAACGRKQP